MKMWEFSISANTPKAAGGKDESVTMGCRVERDAPWGTPAPSSNRTCSFPAYGSPCGTRNVSLPPPLGKLEVPRKALFIRGLRFSPPAALMATLPGAWRSPAGREEDSREGHYIKSRTCCRPSGSRGRNRSPRPPSRASPARRRTSRGRRTRGTASGPRSSSRARRSPRRTPRS